MKILSAVSVIFIAIALLGTGCRLLHPAAGRQTTFTVGTVVRDTTVIVQSDSAAIEALFECDSLNQVVMRRLSVESGRKLHPEVVFRDQVLTVSMPVDSEAVYFELRDRYTYRIDTVYIERPVKKEVSKTSFFSFRLRWWMKLVMAFSIIILISKAGTYLMIKR